MISPFDVVTDGLLNSPLSTSASGYIIIAVSIGDDGGSGGKRYISKFHQRLLDEDEELIFMVVALITGDII